MKANIPRSFDRLPPSEKEKIKEMCNEQINKDMMIVLDILLKMSCQVLHNVFGFGEKRLTCYLANYRMLFKRHIKKVKAGTQLADLDREMIKIFRKSGYPDEFFKMMFADWNIETGRRGDKK